MFEWIKNKVISTTNAVVSSAQSVFDVCTNPYVLTATGGMFVGGVAVGAGTYWYFTGTAPLWLGNFTAWGIDITTPYILPMTNLVRNQSLRVWQWSVQNSNRISEWVVAAIVGGAGSAILIYSRVNGQPQEPVIVPLQPLGNAAGFLGAGAQQQNIIAAGNPIVAQAAQNVGDVQVVPPLIQAALNHINQHINVVEEKIDDLQAAHDLAQLHAQQQLAAQNPQNQQPIQAPAAPAPVAVAADNDSDDEPEPNVFNFN